MPLLGTGAPLSAKKNRIAEEMRKFKMGTLKSSSGRPVTSRRQAIAIALSEAGMSRKVRRSSRGSRRTRR